MKQIIPILVAALVGGAAVFILKSGNNRPAITGDRSKHNVELAQLRKENQQLQIRADRVNTIVVPGETTTIVTEIETSPEEIIEELKLIRPTGDTRQQSMREVIHYMVSLTKAEAKALPAIEKFLASKNEVEYESTALNFQRERQEAKEAQARGEEGGPGGISSMIRSGIGSYIISSVAQEIRRELTPRSLRLGLFYVLSDIGGEQAEQLLARELNDTLRGLEVAFLDRLLDEMAPGIYKAKVLEVTHELLTNPPATDGNSLLDEASRMFLFALLIKYNDATFVDQAKTMIINAEGRVDGAVVNYLTTILGEQAVPLLYAKLKDKSLTDDGDRMALAASVLKHVGTNPESNEYFKEVLLNKELGPMRYLALGNLTGGGQSEDTLRNRQKLIAEIRADSEDEALNGMLDRTNDRIEVMIDPSKADELGGNQGEGLQNLFRLFNQGRPPNKK
jgi:hypothetical protein